MDLVELDAASNNNVANIREITSNSVTFFIIIFKKLKLEITKYICTLVNTMMVKLGKYLLIQIKKVNL